MANSSLKQQHAQLKRQMEIRVGLPHLFSFKFYPFMREFWETWKTYQYFFAANQLGKSSIMIRRMVHIITETKTWTQFSRRPRLMFYFYPDKNTIKREVETKWPEFLPQGKFKDDPKYGYKINYQGQWPSDIEWNNGIRLYFITYGTSNLKESVQRIQASTPSICACDEVLPEKLVNEVVARISSPANKGAMLWQACTPTRFEKYLKDIQDGTKVMPDSWVKTISLWDCVLYEDGTPSPWTREEIEKKMASYSSKREVEIRVFGKFAAAEGRAYEQYFPDRHFVPRHPWPKDWELYCGIDYGSGGKTGHPSSICFVAVNPEFNKGRVVAFCRMDEERWQDGTTEDDVIIQYLEMCQKLGVPFAPNTYYDWACASIEIIANRRGISLLKANKNREFGVNLLNALFKNDMLLIYDDEEKEAQKLSDELEELLEDTDKKHAKDDGIDALRYAISSVVWDFTNIKITETHTKTTVTRKLGRHVVHAFDDDYEDDLEAEIDEWNEYYG